MKISLFKKTSDNWYPNFDINDDKSYVMVSFFPLNPITEGFRVCVWGNDDCGMEYDDPDELSQKQLFLEICMLPFVSKDWLLARGFVNS